MTPSVDWATPALQTRVIVFTRYPQPGQTKTRLIPALGAEGAADLQRLMTEHLLARLRPGVDRGLFSLEVHFTGGSLAQMQAWLGAEMSCRGQVGTCLGDRLTSAFRHNFEASLAPVIALGSDCPDIDTERVLQAVAGLHQSDLVLGPAADGGYYLIGLRRFYPQLFRHIAWGSADVLHQTTQVAKSHNLSMTFLSPLADIDRPEDLPIWDRLYNSDDRATVGLSSSPQTEL
ncbi:MAG: glycosyltransferase [Leptolyngbyaceae cyanobacterium SM2_3_12]|nr:glycosyltransferase [Leptolyngbyaceae cyanobacterium SM2_3_12]